MLRYTTVFLFFLGICRIVSSQPIVIDRPLTYGFVVPDTLRNPDVVVIHSSYCPTSTDSFSLPCILSLYKKYDVSAHYIIDRAGRIYRLVNERYTSHHGGKGILPDGSRRVNTRSIGIELINTQFSDYSTAQYHSLAWLIRDISLRWQIKYIVGHKDIASGRKSDPWNFDWEILNRLLYPD